MMVALVGALPQVVPRKVARFAVHAFAFMSLHD